MQYVITRKDDGTFSAALHLPAGNGTLAAVAEGITKAEAMHKAAKVATAANHGPNKAEAVSILAKGAAAATPMIKDLLKTQGLEAAKAAASMVPGGGAVMAALSLASKYGPAKRLFGRLLS